MMRKVRLKVDHEIEQKGWDRAARDRQSRKQAAPVKL